MTECVTEAVVLEKEPAGESDLTVTLFTEALGKVRARVTSGRKITSKLAAHVEPGFLTSARLVAKNSAGMGARFQLADALSLRRLYSDYAFLDIVGAVTLEGAEDHDLWRLMLSGNTERGKLLAFSGLGGENALCISCGLSATRLYAPDQALFCATCSSHIPKKLLTYL